MVRGRHGSAPSNVQRLLGPESSGLSELGIPISQAIVFLFHVEVLTADLEGSRGSEGSEFLWDLSYILPILESILNSFPVMRLGTPTVGVETIDFGRVLNHEIWSIVVICSFVLQGLLVDEPDHVSSAFAPIDLKAHSHNKVVFPDVFIFLSDVKVAHQSILFGT